MSLPGHSTQKCLQMNLNLRSAKKFLWDMLINVMRILAQLYVFVIKSATKK